MSQVEPYGGLTALFLAERVRLVRLAYLICGSVATAEDVVHDVYLTTSRHWDDVRNPRAYVYRAIVNRAREVSRRAAREVPSDRPVEFPDERPSLVDEDLALRNALLQLPDDHRVAIVLRYYGGWAPGAIASALDVNPITVRSWLRRGLQQLRSSLTTSSISEEP